MFVRNLLQSGDYVTIVPAGIKLSLQYSEKGSLESVYVGHANNQVLHSELLTPIIQSGLVPVHININKGTSFVYGCLYCEDILPVEGRLDKEVEMNYISEFLQNPSKFTFYAGHIQSYSVGFSAPLNVGRWLASSGFQVLPSYVVPGNITEDTFGNMLNLDKFKFRFPRIQSYIMHRNGKFDYPVTKIRQLVVKNIKRVVTFDGYITADVYSHDLGSINVSYTDVVRYNIQKGSIILVNEDNQIIDCFNDDSLNNKIQPSKINCSCCGKVLVVPRTGRFRCNDTHCSSVMQQHVKRLTSMLGLKEISTESYNKYAKSVNHIIALPDILDLPEYKGAKIRIDAPNLLFAIVPTNIITRFNDWAVFCNKANNSKDSILYYIQNPDKMMNDLKLDGSVYRRLYNWCQDPQNLNDVVGIFNHENVQVLSTGKKFEGAPIFRGKSIFVTGDFAHGSFEDVRAILASYSAEVYDVFNTAVDCVIIGDLHEHVQGSAIKKARQMAIPVFEESDFFNQYDIDSDLARNL